MAQSDLAALLELAGARLVSNRRADCPRCGAKRTVAYTDETFFCHHGCGFNGNVHSLASELGIRREWLPRDEYQRRMRERQRAGAVARRFVIDCREHRIAFCALWQVMAKARDEAHVKLRANPEDETAWDALAGVAENEREVLVTVTLLSEGAVEDRRRWLEADAKGRERIAEGIILAGGVRDDAGKFSWHEWY